MRLLKYKTSKKVQKWCVVYYIYIKDKIGIVQEVRFVERCSGNTQGIATLVKGMKVTMQLSI